MGTTSTAHRRIATNSIFWTHHWPDEYDRCVVIRGKHYCRRCIVLYPIVAVVMALSLAGLHWPARYDHLLVWGLPIPVTVDLIVEHVGGVAYSRRRQVWLTALMAPALGRGFGRYLLDPSDGLFWAVSVTYTLIWFAAAATGHHRRARRQLSAELERPDAEPPAISRPAT